MLDEILVYIETEYQAPATAMSVYEDSLKTRKQLESSAGSLRYVDDPELAALGYKKINFRNHDYVMLYRVQDHTAYIIAIYHQSQNYEDLFAKEIGIRL